MLPPYLPTSSHHGWPKKQQTRRHVESPEQRGSATSSPRQRGGDFLSKHQAMSIIKDIYLLAYVFM